MAGWISLGISGATILGAIILWLWKGASSWSWVKRSICQYLDGAEALRKMVFIMYGALEEAGLVTGDCSKEVLNVWGEAGFQRPMQELRGALGKGNPMIADEWKRLDGFVGRVNDGDTEFSLADAQEFLSLADKFREEVEQHSRSVKDDEKAIGYLKASQSLLDAAAYILGKAKEREKDKLVPAS